MKPTSTRLGFVNQSSLAALIIAGIALLSSGNASLRAQQTPPAAQPSAAPTTAPEAPKISNDQLDSLVAPIALYPDPLLAQTLAAATYPLEIIQLQQWLGKNPTLKDKALADAVTKQNWDPSIQAMAALPEVVKQLAENIAWTSDLGNAFLAQQADVMDAVQRMRTKAQTAGNLKSSKEQKVESKQVQGKTVVVIEQADPKVVYVPVYNPTVVYGAAVYPYPPIVYPPYVAGRVLAFGTGIAIGAAWNGNWGWNCGWGNNNVNINVNNNYINNFNKTNVNQRITNNSAWQHNGQHRGGAPYSNRTTAQKYGGTARGDSLANRQTTARSQLDSTRQKPALSDRSANAPANRPQNRMSGDTDRIANRQVPKSPSPRTNNAFSGPGSGMDRSSAFASRDRGSRSMASSRSGGMRGGGRRR
jgi:hypothetical protein